MASLLYALESTTYLTSGLADVQKTEDIAVEAAMTRLFALKVAREVFDLSFSIFGSRAFDEDDEIDFMTAYNDFLALEQWEGGEETLHRNIAVTGLLYAQDSGELRTVNPLKMLYTSLSDKLLDTEYVRKKQKLEFKMHPTLHKMADTLEVSVMRLAMASRYILKRGLSPEALSEDTMLLRRMSEAATATYAMAAAAARTNRTYCEGQAHGEHEIELSHSYAFSAADFIERQVKFITNPDIAKKQKELNKRISDRVIDDVGLNVLHMTKIK